MKVSPRAASAVGVGGIKDEKPLFKSASVVEQNKLGGLTSIKEEEAEPEEELTPA